MMPSKRSMEAARKFLKEMADEGFTWYEAASVGQWIADILATRQRQLLRDLPAKSVLKDEDYVLNDAESKCED